MCNFCARMFWDFLLFVLSTLVRFQSLAFKRALARAFYRCSQVLVNVQICATKLHFTGVAAQYAEILIVFHEFQDVDDNIACPCIGHDALHLSHFMQPKLSKILNWSSGLAP